MQCVECGQKEIFKDGACIDCYRKTHTFTTGPKIIDVLVCTHCEGYKYKNTWSSQLFDEVLRRHVKHLFKIKNDLRNIDINTECEDTDQGKKCKIHITGFIDDLEITETHEVTVRLKKTVCDVCSKQYGGYYESIVQIRAEKRKLTKKELENIESIIFNTVENLRAKGNRGLFISDYGLEHGGLDFFISDKNIGLTLAKKVQEQYGGIIKQSSKNTGMRDSKQIYIMTYLVRIPSIRKNDFIEFDKKIFYIISIKGHAVKMLNLNNWEEIIDELKNIQNAKIVGGNEIIKEMILVSQTKDEVQIMDEKKYGITTVKKPKSINFKNKEIKAVKIDDKFFLFPEKQN